MRATFRAAGAVLCSAVLAAAPTSADPPPGKGGGGVTPPPADPAIAFVGGSNEMLGVMNEDGTNVTPLGLAPVRYPAWSPDLDGDLSNGYLGTLAFEMRLADGVDHCMLADVRVVDGAPAAVRVRTLTVGAGYNPAWSPDLDAATAGYQGRIAFVDGEFSDGDYDIAAHAVAWDGNAADPSTVHDFAPVMLVDAAAVGVDLLLFLTWSPDGTRLAFSTIGEGMTQAVLAVDDLANPQARAITNNTAASYNAPDWSTTGVVAYSKSRSIVLNDVDHVGEFVTGASGNSPSFSLDDASIVFSGMVGRNWGIQRHGFSTGVTTTLLAQRRIDFKDPDWRPFD